MGSGYVRRDLRHEKTWLARSSSRLAVEHELHVGDEGLRCACAGFLYRHECRHVKAVAAAILEEWELEASSYRPASDRFTLEVGQLQDHVYTSRYQSRELLSCPQVAPIRITLGYPKFGLGYQLFGQIMEFAPTDDTFPLVGDAWRESYLRQLERLGIERCLDRLLNMTERADGKLLVLCCFEDVLGKAQPCHRRLLADWLLAETGLIIPELRPADVGIFEPEQSRMAVQP